MDLLTLPLWIGLAIGALVGAALCYALSWWCGKRGAGDASVSAGGGAGGGGQGAYGSTSSASASSLLLDKRGRSDTNGAESAATSGPNSADMTLIDKLSAKNRSLQRSVERASIDNEELRMEMSRLVDDLNLTSARLDSARRELRDMHGRFVRRDELHRATIQQLQTELGRLTGTSSYIQEAVALAKQQLTELQPFVGLRIENTRAKSSGGLRGQRSRGVLVKRVIEHTPAEAHGLQKGDIIEQIDARNADDSTEVMQYIAERKPGDLLSLQIKRDASILNIVLEVGSRTLPRAEVEQLRRRASGVLDPTEVMSRSVSRKSVAVESPSLSSIGVHDSSPTNRPSTSSDAKVQQ